MVYTIQLRLKSLQCAYMECMHECIFILYVATRHDMHEETKQSGKAYLNHKLWHICTLALQTQVLQTNQCYRYLAASNEMWFILSLVKIKIIA